MVQYDNRSRSQSAICKADAILQLLERDEIPPAPPKPKFKVGDSVYVVRLLCLGGEYRWVASDLCYVHTIEHHRSSRDLPKVTYITDFCVRFWHPGVAEPTRAQALDLADKNPRVLTEETTADRLFFSREQARVECDRLTALTSAYA